MANGSSSSTRILGIVLVAAGVGLAFWGYHLSDTVGSRISHAFTGSYTDKEMTFYLAGAASFFVGLFLVMKS
ncbi:MAG TPA: DUF3185 family protein [Gallionella sp.]|nr:DUF3185 family protein [Gallionella sp.]